MTTKKMISMTSGTNDEYGFTKAKTEAGYIKAAKNLWPYADTYGVRFYVYDKLHTDKKGRIHGDLIYEGVL